MLVRIISAVALDLVLPFEELSLRQLKELHQANGLHLELMSSIELCLLVALICGVRGVHMDE